MSEVFCPVWRVGVNLSFFSSSNFLFSSVYPFINPTLTLHCWVATLRIWAKSICQEANRYRTCSAPPKPQEVMRNLRSLGFKLLFVYTIHKYSVDYVYIYIVLECLHNYIIYIYIYSYTSHIQVQVQIHIMHIICIIYYIYTLSLYIAITSMVILPLCPAKAPHRWGGSAVRRCKASRCPPGNRSRFQTHEKPQLEIWCGIDHIYVLGYPLKIDHMDINIY